ncbi:MAG TPA: bifunctional phosphoribosyl-AMP cyclohydrolase/phosphoribosyl-ATP diphosphatase HisIE [Bacteroides sp.]|nr:bifunctional phosphoribosyl-AMP cyclohydrolase/phosphoribosyl-ATP diphosphatase HisIE [Bacteroides sp.]
MALNFEKLGGILPAIIQDSDTNEVLMLGFVNQESYDKTIAEGKVCFYSRTKERLWTKGEESGNFLNVVEITEDCDHDTLLIRVEPVGPVCHTGERTCFGEASGPGLSFLTKLQNLLKTRKKELPEGSYTSKLFKAGVNRIAKKLGEEAIELVIEAKDDDDSLFLNEAADLLFHMMILLVDRGYELEDVTRILEERH